MRCNVFSSDTRVFPAAATHTGLYAFPPAVQPTCTSNLEVEPFGGCGPAVKDGCGGVCELKCSSKSQCMFGTQSYVDVGVCVPFPEPSKYPHSVCSSTACVAQLCSQQLASKIRRCFHRHTHARTHFTNARTGGAGMQTYTAVYKASRLRSTKLLDA